MLGACALLAMAAVSCSKDASDNSASNATDSLSTTYGKYVGSMLYSDFSQFGNEEGNLQDNKKAFLMGMQTIFASKDDRFNRMGMQVALQMMNELQQMEAQGVKINRSAVLNSFKEAFMSDTLSMEDIQKVATQFQMQMTAARAEAMKIENEKKAEAPEAIQNGKAAEAFINNLKANNPKAQTAPDGLTYVIENPGQGAKPTADATVVVNYTGKLLNGDVFDTSEGRGPATFPLQGVIPGFREGLMLLGQGGKATLYIPGDLAYGPEGAPQAGIGPNAMLIFEVELLEIMPAAK